MADKVSVVVSVEEGRLKDFPRMVQAMRRAGLQVESEMAAIGTVAGSLSEQALPRLQAIEGVAHVERTRSFHVPPPHSKVQ
ncbi:hypothetical protein [Benzoatithermus flavus]|uniref:Ketohydroxyglutarate aldolase n=1 Tax=Benzoatithermus flavus TaxID=3108223 RepID=A0ABU8XSA8_9PROT